MVNPVFVPDEATILAVPARHRKVEADDTISEMTTAEKATVDDEATALAAHKEIRYAEIRVNDEALMPNFTFQAKTFELDPPSREKWTGLKQAKDAGLINPSPPTPQKVGDIDNDVLELTNQAMLDDFYSAALAAAKGHWEAGLDLRTSVFDATTRAAVDAVVDSR